MRVPPRLLLAFVIALALAGGTAGAAVLAQPNVAKQVQAAPGSGKGVKLGYISNKEAVPIVHVISVGIEQQAKRAGVQLVFCDAAGDTAKALDCAKSF
jgi:ribose transport system substrate-binding protein